MTYSSVFESFQLEKNSVTVLTIGSWLCRQSDLKAFQVAPAEAIR